MNKWVEPLGVLVLGLLVMQLLMPLGLWLAIAGFALLMHEQISYSLQRSAILDQRDASIEATAMQAVLKGQRAEHTKGFALAESNVQLINHTPELRDAFTELDPELKALLGKKEVAA